MSWFDCRNDSCRDTQFLCSHIGSRLSNSKFTFIIMNKEYVTLHNYYMAEAKEESRVTQYIELNEAQCGQEGISDVAVRN